jgi:hypothetical protein
MACRDKPGLAKAVSNAPEYAETYFELKRLDSGQKDGKELRCVLYLEKNNGSTVTTTIYF